MTRANRLQAENGKRTKKIKEKGKKKRPPKPPPFIIPTLYHNDLPIIDLSLYASIVPCLACGETFLDEEMWHDIPGRGGTCDIECQYTILISNWVKKETPIEATWQRAVR
ncbi:hypothetical protein G9A89_001087 [Geosiphon pyriformis]|nr:hypothetical protein G9A89_001087 [Geosiphon pyriformis]